MSSQTQLNTTISTTANHQGNSIARYLPFLDWLRHYDRAHLPGDLIAGVIVAIMLVPQGMAYAMLAGLPPEVGLYASIIPLTLYGLLGSSKTLAVGPVAMVSLLVASGVAQAGAQTIAEAVALALTLALMIGVMQLLMGIFRAGFLVNFLSHPVLSGFTSAAALVIGFSQLKHLLGISLPNTEYVHETILYTVTRLGEVNPVVLLISGVSIAVLLYFKYGLKNHLMRLNLSPALVVPLTKTGPLVLVILMTGLVALFNWNETAAVAIVGAVPGGLPPLTMPNFDLNAIQRLLPIAITISLVGFMESISVAKSLASKRRQKVDANQELVALGVANISAAFTGGYPVTGGFSRSMVNFTAGANTGLASIITAGLIALTVLFFTPLFYYLPKAVLGAVIVVAVASLVDFKTVPHTWQYNRPDAVSFVVTFLAVLFVGIEAGIIIGALTALVLYLWRTSRPHIAIVGRIGETEEYRNVLRHEVTTYPHIMALRVDESLYFPNAQYLEHVILNALADNPQLQHFVLVCNAINYIDASALDVLETLADTFKENDVTFNFSEVKGPVMDCLQRIGFVDKIGAGHFFLSTHDAMQALLYDTQH